MIDFRFRMDDDQFTANIRSKDDKANNINYGIQLSGRKWNERPAIRKRLRLVL